MPIIDIARMAAIATGAVVLAACVSAHQTSTDLASTSQAGADSAAQASLNERYVEEIVAAERAFAAEGYENGVKSSFLKWSAADAVMLSPGPVNAHEALAGAPDRPADAAGPHLVWWPLYAGAARSGDLGFTTGPYAFDEDRRGYYFTVWRREADSAWKWVFDAGVGADATAAPVQGTPVSVMKQAGRAEAMPSPHGPRPLEQVIELESALADTARSDAAGAYAPYLAADSRFHSARTPPAVSPDTIPEALAARPPVIAFAHIGGGASAAGDIVWTYGVGRWAESGAEREGYYARIWRNGAEGWRIAFDEFIPIRQSASDQPSE
ncbi:MAG: hypothetical protein R3C40_03640 [Parvularculaceae bacterium]|nr:hypothetical protein [Parvularculaceae bacterium]